MFKRLSFRAKLLSLCALLSAITAVVGIIGFVGLESVMAKYNFIIDKTAPKIQLANHMFLEYRRVRIQLRTLGIPGISAKEAEASINGALDAIEKYEAFKKEYVGLGFIPGQQERWEALDKAWGEFKQTGGRVISLYKSGKPEDITKMIDIFFHECPEKAKVFTMAGEDLLKFHDSVGAAKSAEAKELGMFVDRLALGAVLAGILVGLGLGLLIASSLTKALAQIVQKLTENAAQVSSASSQIASSSEELSQASTEQASSLEETAASLEEINAMITKASENAQTTADRSAESQDKAEKGRTAVDQMLNSMTEISDSNEAIMAQINVSNQQMAEIVKVIEEIGNKTKVINEIVFQTKLLSFNASVEAARAGEHGKGFAVVAEEVGNLAQMSGNAAKEISEMLQGSISKVEGIVQETKTKVETLIQGGKQKVEAGTSVATQCSEVLNEILENVSTVSRLSQEISQASKEQSQGVAEINKAMSQLDTVTQQNSATSEEAASAAEELSAQAESLKMVVDDLVALMQGEGKTAGSVTPTKAVTRTAEAKGSSNVIPFRSSKKSSPVAAPRPATELRAAAGDSVPSRDDAGFRDI